MIGELPSKEEVDAALMLVLSVALMVLVANGDGSLSIGRIVPRVLSNPIPVRGAMRTRGDASVFATDRQIVA